MQFEITAKQGKARTGILTTSYGKVNTPAITVNFTPALIRTRLEPKKLKELGVEMVLVNVLHAHIAGVGETHKDLDWDGSVFCDSGGFQMVSLSEKSRVHRDGVDFMLDGVEYKLTPQIVAEWQKDIGVDIIMPLDYVVHVLGKNPLIFIKSVLITQRWFQLSHGIAPDKMFYIVQGGLNRVARDISIRYANEWLNANPPGIAIGGLAGGEKRSTMYKMVNYCTTYLVDDKPRHLLGVGTPIDLLECIERGVDTFDCVASTREARHGRLWTSNGYLQFGYERHKDDHWVIEEECDCPVCSRGTTRAELISAMSHKDPNDSPKRQAERDWAIQQCMLHNIRFVMRLMGQSRESIKRGDFPHFKKSFIKKFTNSA
mgnify:CR=1 FL=1